MQEYFQAFLTAVVSFMQSPEVIPGWIFFGLLIAWLVFSAVLAYHWFTYNLGSAFTPIALAAYAFGSFMLIGYTATGLS